MYFIIAKSYFSFFNINDIKFEVLSINQQINYSHIIESTIIKCFAVLITKLKYIR